MCIYAYSGFEARLDTGSLLRRDLGNEHCRWITQNAIFDQKPLVVKEWRAGIWNVGTLGKNVFRARRH